ncbi:hypothetical protein FKP32DRAFT_582866 [Trametes sanguinea]|nr:hypothetical protein FKP32DRAFT_582866 [Trametes sanguinea]
MHNIMAALLHVKENHVGKDGLTIGQRLEDVVQKVAQDIRECANACNAYSRQRFLAKVFKALSWDLMLKDYIRRFNDCKAESTFAISFHTGIGVDRANEKLDILMTKMDVVLEFSEKTVPREQRILSVTIRAAGGPRAALTNTDALQELLAKNSSSLPRCDTHTVAMTCSRALAGSSMRSDCLMSMYVLSNSHRRSSRRTACSMLRATSVQNKLGAARPIQTDWPVCRGRKRRSQCRAARTCCRSYGHDAGSWVK